MFTILVINKYDGKPAKDERVSVAFKGWFRGSTASKYTDRNGEVHFTEDNGEGIVYVNGENQYEGEIAGRIVIYV